MDQINLFDAEIIGTKNTHIEITYAQIVLILEALNNYRKDIEENFNNTNGPSGKKFLELKVENINNISEYLEHGINYSFQDTINKCHNRRKTHKVDEEGMETFNWLEP